MFLKICKIKFYKLTVKLLAIKLKIYKIKNIKLNINLYLF